MLTPRTYPSRYIISFSFIHHFHINRNLPCLSPKTLYKHSLGFLLGRLFRYVQIYLLKSKFSFILFAYNLMIGCSKKERENYPGKCFSEN